MAVSPLWSSMTAVAQAEEGSSWLEREDKGPQFCHLPLHSSALLRAFRAWRGPGGQVAGEGVVLC